MRSLQVVHQRRHAVQRRAIDGVPRAEVDFGEDIQHIDQRQGDIGDAVENCEGDTGLVAALLVHLLQNGDTAVHVVAVNNDGVELFRRQYLTGRLGSGADFDRDIQFAQGGAKDTEGLRVAGNE